MSNVTSFSIFDCFHYLGKNPRVTLFSAFLLSLWCFSDYFTKCSTLLTKQRDGVARSSRQRHYMRRTVRGLLGSALRSLAGQVGAILCSCVRPCTTCYFGHGDGQGIALAPALDSRWPTPKSYLPPQRVQCPSNLSTAKQSAACS